MSPASIESELLVSTGWVDEHRNDDNVRIVESEDDLLLYQQGHICEPEPDYLRGTYTAKDPDLFILAFRNAVLQHQAAGKSMIDVRSPGEYTGEMLHMDDYPQEDALRAGHIPGAASVPWSRAVHNEGTFKSKMELE